MAELQNILVPSLAGTCALVMAALIGWKVAPLGQLFPVHIVRWWVRHVALRAITAQSRIGRTITIFLNNTAVCGVVVAAGYWSLSAWIVVTVIGISLGIGLYVLGDMLTHDGMTGAQSAMSEREESASLGPMAALDMEEPGATVDRRILFGVVLNLLEVPAIMLSLGLCLSQQAIPRVNILVDQEFLIRTFVTLVVPLLLVAAWGEAMWLGLTRIIHNRNGAKTG